jgi:hypothetical protein
MEVQLLTYDIVRRVPTHTIQQEQQFGPATINDWAKLCREGMLDYVLGSSQKIGGPNKTVEIDESKFGRRKYNRGHNVKGRSVVFSASPEKHS